MKMTTEEIISGGIGLVIGLIVGGLGSYINERAKNAALKKDLKGLTEEKEKIISEHQLVIAKRKYQYEDKRKQYFKYFELLDEINGEGNQVLFDSFGPMINQFFEDFLKADNNKELQYKATSILSSQVNDLMLKANEHSMRLKKETSSLRLIASDAVLKTLNELERSYDISIDHGSDLLKGMADNVVNGRSEILEKQQQESARIAEKMNVLKDRLMEEVRMELNEI